MKDKPVILVVDDQPQNIELLEAHLIPQGYEDDYEVEYIFSNIGHKIMLLNAQCFQYNSTSCPVNGKTGAQCACIFTGKHKGRLFDPINTHLYFVLTLEPLNDSYIHERRRYPFKEKAIIVIIAKNICKRRFYNV